MNYPTFDDDEILDFYNAGPEIEIDECDDSKVAVRKLTGQSETLHPILQSDSGRSEPQMDPRGREDLDDVVFDDDDIVDWFNSEPGAAIDERQVNDTATITTSHSEAAGAQFGLQDHGDVAQAKRREQRVAGDHVNQGDGNAAEPESAWHPSLLSDIDRRLLRVLRITDGMLLEWYFALRQALGDTYEKMKAWWASADAAARDEALNCEWPTVAQLKADLEAKGFRSRHLPNTLYTTKGPRTK